MEINIYKLIRIIKTDFDFHIHLLIINLLSEITILHLYLIKNCFDNLPFLLYLSYNNILLKMCLNNKPL